MMTLAGHSTILIIRLKLTETIILFVIVRIFLPEIQLSMVAKRHGLGTH